MWAEMFRQFPSLAEVSRTIIHEALHRTHGAWGDYGRIDDMTPAVYGALPMTQTLTNPDTYAMFAREAVKCP